MRSPGHLYLISGRCAPSSATWRPADRSPRSQGLGRCISWAEDQLGKSDPIGAEAVALAALRHSGLPVAELDGPTREVKLLADHRRAPVAECTRIQNRLRWHLHELETELIKPGGPWRTAEQVKAATLHYVHWFNRTGCLRSTATSRPSNWVFVTCGFARVLIAWWAPPRYVRGVYDQNVANEKEPGARARGASRVVRAGRGRRGLINPGDCSRR